MKALAHRFGFGRFGDYEGFSFTDGGQSFDEVAIDGGADAEGEKIGLSEVLANEFEGIGLEADEAVCDDEQRAGTVALLRHGEGVFEGGDEFSAAATSLAIEEGDRFGDVF